MTERKKTIKQMHQEIIDSALRLVKELATSKFPEIKDKVKLARMTEAHFIYLVALPYTITKILDNDFELDMYDSLIDTGITGEGMFERLRSHIDEDHKLAPRLTVTDIKDVTLPDDVAPDDHEALPRLNLSLQPDLNLDDLPEAAKEDESPIVDNNVDNPTLHEELHGHDVIEPEDGLEPLSAEDIVKMKDMVK